MVKVEVLGTEYKIELGANKEFRTLSSGYSFLSMQDLLSLQRTYKVVGVNLDNNQISILCKLKTKRNK